MPLIINNGVYRDDDAGYNLVINVYGLDRTRPILLQDVAQRTPSIAFVLPSTRAAPPLGQLTGNWTAIQIPAQDALAGESQPIISLYILVAVSTGRLLGYKSFSGPTVSTVSRILI